jgi:hypothetical protein
LAPPKVAPIDRGEDQDVALLLRDARRPFELHQRLPHAALRKMAARPYLSNAVRETTSQVQSVLGSVPFRKIVGG